MARTRRTYGRSGRGSPGARGLARNRREVGTNPVRSGAHRPPGTDAAGRVRLRPTARDRRCRPRPAVTGRPGPTLSAASGGDRPPGTDGVERVGRVGGRSAGTGTPGPTTPGTSSLMRRRGASDGPNL